MRTRRCVLGGTVATVAFAGLTALPAAAAAQTAPEEVPFERRAVNAPTTVPADETAARVPQFLVDPFWPKPLPHNWIVGQVAGVDVGPDDRVWIVQRPGSLSERERGAEQDPPIGKCCVAAPPVLVFDLSGNLVHAWGGPGDGYDWPANEHGIFVDDEGFVWLAGNGQTDRHVLKFSADGEFVLQIGRPGSAMDSNDSANLGRPADVYVDVEAREAYVADGYGNRRVIVFDSETGEYKRHWGAYGLPPNDAPLPDYDPAAAPARQFRSPVHCIQVARDGLVYACDRVSNRYHVFRKDGTLVAEAFFEPDTLLNGSVSDVALSQDAGQAFLYMVDSVNNELRIIDRASHTVLGRVGRPGRWAGQFHSVHNIAIDSQGNLYTTEVNTGQRVQKFRRLDRR